MNLIFFKKIFFSNYFKIFFSFLIIFVLLDIAFSNLVIKNLTRKDCFKYIRYSLNEKNYYTYELEKNCRAYETKGTAKTYDVFTDENGNRISKNKKAQKNKKGEPVVFLGDSFTYGFGVNYEDSIVGILESKKINYETINLAVPGYSPLMLKYKLRDLIKSGVRPKKVFYLMDLTDVHDESNRWMEFEELKYPVIFDETVHEEIKSIFNFKSHFKMTRLLIYNLNKSFRNLRKEISRKKFEREDKIIGYTQWANFTHMPFEELNKDIWKKNDFKTGLNNIIKNVKSIAEITKEINSEFYIVIYPWPETLEYGENYFSWQKFAEKLCQLSNCSKLINAFPEFNKIKEKFSHWKKEIYILQDVHLNANGNRLLAEIIYKSALKY